jgi:hypothetical protein
MGQGVRKSAAWVVALAAVAALATGLLAQTLPERAADALTPEERECLDEYEQDHLITARRLAEAIVAGDDRSMIGHYVLGNVLRRGEGALSPAMEHLGRARELYENMWSVAPADPGAPWQLHRELLRDIIDLAQELERYDYRLQMLEYHDAIYDPDLHAERAWTLLKMDRLQEGREAAALAAAAAGPAGLQGLNALCAIETRAGTRTARADACGQALGLAQQLAASEVSESPADGTNVAVHAYNAALALLATFDMAAAEQAALAGTRRLTYTPANPWRLLTSMYLAQGRSDEATTALLEMDRWRQRQPPWLRDQDRAQGQVVTAQLLLVAGETDAALDLVSMAIEHPDRRGLTSSLAEQAVGGYALTRLAVAATHIERQRELAAAWDQSGWIPPHIAASNEWSRQLDIERVRAAMTTDRLVATARPYDAAALELPVWLWPQWVEAVGPAVVDSAAYRAASDPELGENGLAYLMALDCLSSAARGDIDAMERAGEAAASRLPQAEVLLRGTLHAVRGLHLQRVGRNEQAAAQLAAAWDLDPSAIRRVGATLPAQVVSQGGELADTIARRLRNSPRLVSDSSGFTVTVAATTQRAEVCMAGIHGEELGCAVHEATSDLPDPPESTDPDAFVAASVDAFHRELFSMPVQLNTISRSSLDGRTSASSAAARERVRQSLRVWLDRAREGSGE